MKIVIEDKRVLIDDKIYLLDSTSERLQIDSGFSWGTKSLTNLDGVHDELRNVFDFALSRSPIDMAVIEGLRTRSRQVQLVDSGASWTMNSRHLTGHAVDVAPIGEDGKISWSWPLYHRLATVIKQAAKEIDVDVEWGGDWTKTKDGPHWQLSWSKYPK